MKWTKKDFEIDSAKRVIEEDKQTKQHELDKDNKEADRTHIEKNNADNELKAKDKNSTKQETIKTTKKEGN